MCTWTALGALAAALGLGGCGSSSSTSTDTITGPSSVKCAIDAQLDSASYPPTGGSGAIHVSTNRECTWTAQSNADWLKLAAPAKGQGAGTVSFTIAANPNPGVRNARVSINDRQVDVAQQGRPCVFRLSATRETVEAAGGDRTIKVDASSTDCPWTAESGVPWITIMSGREGDGDGSVTFRVTAADGPQRTGRLTIAGQPVEVEQGSGCTFAIGTASFDVPASGGSREVPVTAPSGCAWTAETQADWLSIASGASGAGAATVTFRIASSDGPERIGTLSVAGRTVTVKQASGCRYVLDGSKYSAPASGGGSSVGVRAGAGCTWAASAGAGWISITNGAAGSGNGRVEFTVAANTSPARSSTLNVGGQAFTIEQANGCTYAINPDDADFPGVGGTGYVTVATGDGCPWSSASNASWMTITSGASGSGNGRTDFRVAENTDVPRQGTLTIAGQTFTARQSSGCSYEISPTRTDVPALGGAGTVSLSTGPGCGWLASSNDDWLTVTVSSGEGPGDVGFVAAPNLGGPRTGTLTIGRQTFTVNQAGVLE